LRAVRAAHDPVWTADGYVSDRWRPVSPVTGRLDAFQWQTPLAALPSDKAFTVESSAFTEAMLAPRRVEPPAVPPAEPSHEIPTEPTPPLAAQDNSPVTVAPAATAAPPPAAPIAIAPVVAAPAVATAPAATTPVEAPVPAAPPPEPPAPSPPPPLFRPRPDLDKSASNAPPLILPIVRAPDDPGIDDDPLADEFAERMGSAPGQAGGWRGFLARWGG
jgi:HemY protein